MEYLLTFAYTTVDFLSLIFFLDAFFPRRWHNRSFWIYVAGFILLSLTALIFNRFLLGGNPITKIFLVLATNLLAGIVLYGKMPISSLFLLVVLEYLLVYALSFAIGMLSAAACGMDGEEFKDAKIPFIIYSAFYYSAELFSALTFRKIISLKDSINSSFKLKISQLALYFLFPVASYSMLVILLYTTGDQDVTEPTAALCCILIFFANVAILFLLEQMEYAMQNREQLLALGQQLQLQAKNMEATRALYDAQRKETHDFRAHTSTLYNLLRQHKYTAAEDYLDSITNQQTDRLFLVNTYHPILDSLFNTKAAECVQRNIDMSFEVNDLSKLPLDAADMVVLLSNLLDNAIEACEKCPREKCIQIRAIADRTFFFSVRNTTEPVKILHDTILTTKSNPQMHGFGLANVKLILKKYHGDFVMLYNDGWFQFTGEIDLSPFCDE